MFFLFGLCGTKSTEGFVAVEASQQLEVSIPFPFVPSKIQALPAGGFVIQQSRAVAVLTNDLTAIWSAGGNPLQFPLAVQPDGRFVCLGYTNHCIFRVNLDRSLDASFLSPAVSEDDLTLFNTVESQPDNKVLVGCYPPPLSRPPSQYAGINNGLFRLNSNGTDDATFQASIHAPVFGIIAVPDGRILVNLHWSINRYLADGTPDPTFNQLVASRRIDQFVTQTDGKIVIAGDFSKIGDAARPGLARLNEDGTVDVSFNPTAGPGSSVSVRIQKDGGILVATFGSVSRWFSNGLSDSTFRVFRGQGIYGMDLDASERIYFNDGTDLLRFSGHTRIIAPAANIPLVLEKSSIIESGWAPINTVPANASLDLIIDSDFPGTANTFFRIRPAQ